jgi:EAL domain-containing protein (putative c-di-GMP-specific phosphodiesterase class I)
MYTVKERGGNGVLMCGAVGKNTIGRLSLETEFRAALERDEFLIYYQPQISFKQGQLVGMEALTRWQHPSRGIIDPSGFIPIAEHTGLITVLGEIVLRRACHQVVQWQTAGLEPPLVAVNVSARQFYQRDFIGMIKRVLDETGIDSKMLELEITETVAVQKTDHGLQLLERLRDLGITIAIDDFGTGQSSLSYLKNFPLDVLKIDKSFVREIAAGSSNESIVNAVLLLADQLGLRTVAEGVENETQWNFLRDRGCYAAQGFLISRPIPPEEFAKKFLSVDSTLPFGQTTVDVDAWT